MTRDLFYGVTEQAKASRHRWDDALALFDASRWRGAMYMAGYAIECMLKMKLMQMFECRHLQELEETLRRRGLLASPGTVFTHELADLLRLTRRAHQLRQDAAAWRSFTIVNRWVPAWRYTANLANRDDAAYFLNAVEAIRQWIENNV